MAKSINDPIKTSLSIQDKLKKSVKASLAKAEEAKQSKITKKPKKPTKKSSGEDELSSARIDDRTREYLGIPKATARPKDICVYRITYHNRARLDHIKYPNERMRKLEDSPIFATHKDADKWCKAKEKEDPANIYFARMTWIPEPEVPKDVMKKILKRGW